MLLGFAPAVLALLAYNQATTGSPLLFGYEVYWPYDRLGFGPGIGVNGEHTLPAARLNLSLNVEAMQHYLFGWPGGWSLAPAGLGLLAALARLAWRLPAALWRMRPGRLVLGEPGAEPPTIAAAGDQANGVGQYGTSALSLDLLWAALPLSLILVHLAYWNLGLMYGPRYYFEALGALALLSARGLLFVAMLVGSVLRIPGRASEAHASAAGTLLVLAALAILFAAGYWAWAPQTFGAFVRWYGITGIGLQTVRAARLHNALVFVHAPTWEYYAAFFVQNAPTLDGNIVYARDRGPDTNTRLMASYPGRGVWLWDGEKLMAAPLAEAPVPAGP